MTDIRSSSKNAATSGTAISVSAPSGVQAGDLVVITVHVNSNTTIADNNGGTPFTEDLTDYSPNTSTGHTIATFSRRIVSGDPSTYNFTSGASGRWSIIAVCFRNPHKINKFDNAPSTSNAANTDFPPGTNTVTCPSITTTYMNSIHCVVAFIDTGGDTFLTFPSGYTAHQTQNLTQPQSFYTKVIGTPASTGAQTFTFDGSGAGVLGISFSVRDENDSQYLPIIGAGS